MLLPVLTKILSRVHHSSRSSHKCPQLSPPTARTSRSPSVLLSPGLQLCKAPASWGASTVRRLPQAHLHLQHLQVPVVEAASNRWSTCSWVWLNHRRKPVGSHRHRCSHKQTALPPQAPTRGESRLPQKPCRASVSLRRNSFTIPCSVLPSVHFMSIHSAVLLRKIIFRARDSPLEWKWRFILYFVLRHLAWAFPTCFLWYLFTNTEFGVHFNRHCYNCSGLKHNSNCSRTIATAWRLTC